MATDPTSYCIPTGSLIAPIGTIVAIGDTVTGLGIPFGTTVIDVINQGNKTYSNKCPDKRSRST